MFVSFPSLLLILLWLSFSTYSSTMANKYYRTPRLPFGNDIDIPNPLRSNQKGTWAFDTMSRRIHSEILPRIIDDNTAELSAPTSSLRSECLMVLRDLESGLQCGRTGQLRGICDDGPDVKLWNDLIYSLEEDERNWLDAPWVVAEFYFYRRIVEAFRFFETGYDMFMPQKVKGLFAAVPSINLLAKEISTALTTVDDIDRLLRLSIATSLWGNKMDLSIWPSSDGRVASQNEAESGKISEISSLDAIQSFILDNHTDAVVRFLKQLRMSSDSKEKEISIIVDNAGYELVTDLVLGHCLLQLGIADVITYHTKAHPTFVSDALSADLLGHISFLAGLDNSDLSDTVKLANKLKEYLDSGKFRVKDDLFWCQPYAFWDMPDTIEEELSFSKLIFVKGDANYRRMLGEREWQLDTPTDAVFSYWPIPVCALRTFKSEIGCGISSSEQKRATGADKDWMVSGKWGVIQFGGPSA